MRVLVTGASGFIGRWVGQALRSHSFEWMGVDNRSPSNEVSRRSHMHFDIQDRERLIAAFEEFKPEAVIHLAARCDLEGQKLKDYDANITGVRNVCEAVRRTPSVKRSIYTSSQLVCKVGHVPLVDDEYCPNTLYGESKVRTEEIAREENGGAVEWCIARPTTVWGPGMSEHYQSLLNHIKKGTYFHSGRGALYKSYSYAENIAYQYCKLLTAPAEQIHKQVFYLADYEPLSLRDYANALAHEMGVRTPSTLPMPLAKLLALGGDTVNRIGIRFPYNSFRLNNIRTEYIFDLSKTEAVCGPLPKTTFEGIRETARWYIGKL